MSASVSQQTRPDEVDASTRLPVLYLAAGAVAWLVLGLAFLLLASLQLHAPALLRICPFMTHGHLLAAGQASIIFGFASQAGLGVGLWILARTAQAPILNGVVTALGNVVWNAGLTLGVVGIFLGDASALPGLDLPAYAAGVILAAHFLVGGSALVGFGLRRTGPLVPAQWYVVAAILWFPWLMATAQVFAFLHPVRGVLQPIIAGWFSQGILWGWAAPLALGSLYHFLPALSGRELVRPFLAPLGFWALLTLAGWTGARTLVGGPVPAWIASTGVVAGVLLVIPVVFIGVNLHLGGFRQTTGGPGFQLSVLGALSFVLGGLAYAITSPRCANRILRFTLFPVALEELLLLGFVTFALLGALYVILPRLIGYSWPQGLLSAAHLGLSTGGLVLVVIGYGAGGWFQGLALDVPGNSINEIHTHLVRWYQFHSAGLALFLLGQLAFVAHVALMVARHLPAARRLALEAINPLPAAAKAATGGTK